MNKLAKRLLSFAVVLCMTASFFAVEASAGSAGCLNYTISNGVATITESPDASGDVVIPDSITENGTEYSVTGIGDYAFDCCTGLKSITIPDSVTSIGESAFQDCSSLTSVTTGNGVLSIGYCAFDNCSSLTSVTLGNSVTSIGDMAFFGCSVLSVITLPDSLSGIGYGAFSLTSLTTVNYNCGKNVAAVTVGSENPEIITDTTGWTKFHPMSYVYNNDATCTSDGTKTYKCACGENTGNTITAEGTKLNHTPAAAVRENIVAATCTATGSYDSVVYCSVCRNELSRESVTAEKTAHTPAAALKGNETEATCTGAGSYDRVVYCSVCKELISTETVTTNAPGHNFSSFVYNNDATCAKDGTITATCSRCNATETFAATGTKLNHTPAAAVKENVTAATCSKEGSYDSVVYCSVCKAEISRETVTTGKIAHTEEIIPATDATCTEAGSTAGIKCSVCGEIIVAPEAVAALSHIDENNDGICDRCGEDLGGTSGETTGDSSCSHICHSDNSFMKFIWKIISFFSKLFNVNQYCSCGAEHW